MLRAMEVDRPYPVSVDPAVGFAFVSVRRPLERSWELTDRELVQAAREHATSWEQFADLLNDLLEAGWSLRHHGGLYATRDTTAAQLPELADAVADRGYAVEWAVPTADGGSLVTLGGMLARLPPPEQTFPGRPLPALVANELTGAQRIVDGAGELRNVFSEELTASAEWWRSHPEEVSDHAAHGLAEELDELAESVTVHSVPCRAHQPVRPTDLFRGEVRHTSVSVHAVSAIRFAGLAEAARQFLGLDQSPRDGLARSIRAEGRELAVDIGFDVE